MTSHASHALLPPADHPLALLKKVSKPQSFKEGQGVKGRMEPAEVSRAFLKQSMLNLTCKVGAIAYIVAGVKGLSVEEVAAAAWQNTMRLFYPDEAGQ